MAIPPSSPAHPPTHHAVHHAHHVHHPVPLRPRFPSHHNSSSSSLHTHRRYSNAPRRASFTSTIPLVPNAESPRTLCPRDHVAFAYDPAHLTEWYMPQTLWEQLPKNLHANIAALQHAGAAVLTGFDRLEVARSDMIQEQQQQQDDQDDQDDSDGSLPLLVLPSADQSKTPSPHDSGFFTAPTTRSTTPSTAPTTGRTSPAISPLELPPTGTPSRVLAANPERIFTTPTSPKGSYYLAELSHLRCESVPRLRHYARRVESEYAEVKRILEMFQRQQAYSQHGAPQTDSDIAIPSLDGFDEWWDTKKEILTDATEKIKLLVQAVGGQASPNMGWGH